MRKIKLNWRPTRPFASAHWSLLALLLALWEFAFGQPCKTGPFYLECGLAISTICIALWANHIQFAPIQTKVGVLRVIGGAVYDLLSFAFLLILASFLFMFVMPVHQSCYTSRAKVSEMIIFASPLRAIIDERALAKNSLKNVGKEMQIVPSGRVKSGVISQDGLIILASDEPPAVVVFVPEFQDSKVHWQCIGVPAKYMPARCR
jgi:hypothetical protein